MLSPTMLPQSNSEFIRRLKILSFNLHGFNQGSVTIKDLIDNDNPDIILCQEHWLTPASLHKFEDQFTNYFAFGCSAMAQKIETGILIGRPFGGVMILIKKDLRPYVEKVHCEERFAIVRVANCIFVDIYLPCIGTKDRQLICEATLQDLWSWRERYPMCECLIAGDFNTDLNSSTDVAQYINDFILSKGLMRCDALSPKAGQVTYCNLALNRESYIDFIITSCPEKTSEFTILDPDVNFSDHLPLMIFMECSFTSVKKSDNTTAFQDKLRWDKADTNSYYSYTCKYLEPFRMELDHILNLISSNSVVDVQNVINSTYNEIVAVLKAAANLFVPVRHKNFFKYWWDEEMTALKEAAVDSNKIWKAAGKPRQGPIFSKRQLCRAHYRKGLRDRQKLNTETYTNDLHQALLHKDGPNFWKCWKSKFETRRKCDEVSGCTDGESVVIKFANYFSEIYTANNPQRAASLSDQYIRMRGDYVGLPLRNFRVFDTELVSTTINGLKRGRAPDIEGLMAEHLIYAHPILSIILSQLFSIILASGYVPCGFGQSYIVPIPKAREHVTKAMTCDDYRGIAISPILSKLFEYCFIEKFEDILRTDEKQFGFQRDIGCQHAVFTVRNIVERFLKGGNTVSLCALDLSKAFDKVNHCALFIKLMKRNVPNVVLQLLEHWMGNSFSAVKWNNVYSHLFSVNFGVRQGSVLSPFLFAVYLDDISTDRTIIPSSFIILYADDIMLISPSVCELQRLFSACESELIWLDMKINIKKSCCIRIGPRYDVTCSPITSVDGQQLPWVSEIRYLGTYIISNRQFKGSFSNAKQSFYRAANAIFGKIGRIASEEVLLELIRSKCLPILIYGSECFAINKRDMASLDFCINRFLMKLFKTGNVELINEIRCNFNFQLPSELIERRHVKFLNTYRHCIGILRYFGVSLSSL